MLAQGNCVMISLSIHFGEKKNNVSKLNFLKICELLTWPTKLEMVFFY